MLTGYQSLHYAEALNDEYGYKYLPGCDSFLKIDKDSNLSNFYSLFCPPEFNGSTWALDLESLSPIGKIELNFDPLIKFNPLTKLHFDTVMSKGDEHYIVDLIKELKLEHWTWDCIRSFAKTGYEVKIRALNHTVNRVDYAKHYWKLHEYTCNKQNITGIPRFNENSVLKQFNVPGLVIFDASRDNNLPVAVRTFFIQGDNVYYHLAASNHKGYGINANHAILYQAIVFFKQLGLSKLVLGTGITEGLKKFKSGFANEIKTNYRLIKP